MIYWFFLFIAIFFEIIGTLSMKYSSVYGGTSGYFFMYVLIGISYVLLSLAVKRIALAVAYALWDGIGIFLITLFSVLHFDEPLSWFKTAALILLLIGITLIKSGMVMPAAKAVQDEK